MFGALDPFRFVLIAVNQRQIHAIDYLREESNPIRDSS